MKQQTIQVSAKAKINVDSIPGDLQVVGWERNELMAKTDGSRLEVTSGVDKVGGMRCGLILCASQASLKSFDEGDADLRALAAPPISTMWA
jgi:hypothetical protein